MVAIPSRTETIRRFKAQGGGIAAVLPIHYSRGLLRAFNLLPVEVWGPPRVPAGQGARHLQAYVCSICHNALSFLYQGGLDQAEVILVPHTCDSLQGLGSVLLDFVKPSQAVLTLYLPREKTPVSHEFLAAEFRALYQRLAEWRGFDPGEAVLAACLDREAEADSLLCRLHLQNALLPYSNREVYRLIRSREYLPAEDFIAIVEKVLTQVEDNPRPGIPVLIEGIVPEPMDFFNVLTEAGAQVVGDDLACCGRRLYPPGEGRDLFLRMAAAILQAPPDPTRGSPLQARSDHLLTLAKRTGAKGVIFYIVKFCEPEYFDLPLLRSALKEAGLASILLEVDLNTAMSQQLRTRLGAFLEMLQ